MADKALRWMVVRANLTAWKLGPDKGSVFFRRLKKRWKNCRNRP